MLRDEPSEDGLPAMDGGPVFRIADELGHGDCGGWTAEQDGTPVCACGTELHSEGMAA